MVHVAASPIARPLVNSASIDRDVWCFEGEIDVLYELGVMPKLGTYSRKSLPSKEWHKELLLSWLFRTCFKLQAALDRRFLHFGMTFQEAAVLMRCVEAGEIVPGRLALVLARDKGKITRFVDHLEASKLVKRQVNPRDRRYSVIKATPNGKRLAERIASTFDQIRKELFVGVLDGDIRRLGRSLPQLHHNAVSISTKCEVLKGRRKKRIGTKRIGSHGVESFPLQESSTEVALSARGHYNCKNDREHEPADDRLVHAESVSSDNQHEHSLSSLVEFIVTR